MSSIANHRLVIFGCGYVGSALADAALKAGARVEALTRNPEKAEALRAKGIKVTVADLATNSWHSQIPTGADFVVNCVSSGGPEHYRRSYVEGMRSVLAWAAGSGGRPIGTMVYTSSTAVYPQGEGSVVDEAADASGSTPNGAIIRESEQLLQTAPNSAVARHFILRLAGIYGPGRHHLLDQLHAGLPVLGGSGAHRLNLAHRDDIVSAILACLAAPASLGSEIFNVADSAPAVRAVVVGWLAGKLGRPVPGFDGSSTTRRGGAPMPDRIISNAKLQRMLGWRPRHPDFRSGFETILHNS